MKGSFLITAKTENIITERGIRAFIMERLLTSAFQKGAVLNLDAKTVQVQLEGDLRQIKEFRTALQKALVNQFGNPVIVFSEFKEEASLELPDLLRSSQALVVGQLEKGIGVQLAILQTLEKIPEKIAVHIKTLEKR